MHEMFYATAFSCMKPLVRVYFQDKSIVLIEITICANVGLYIVFKFSNAIGTVVNAVRVFSLLYR